MPGYTTCPLPAHAAILATAVLFCLLSASCVTSVYPLAENGKGVVYRPELTGTWREADGSTIIRVERGEETAYTITMVEERSHDSVVRKDTTYFTGQLVQADGYLLLDCLVDLEQQKGYKLLDDYTRAGLLPVHFIFQLSFGKNNKTLELAQLTTEAFEKALKERSPATRYKKEGESVVLLEPSANLSKLIVQLLKAGTDVWEKSTWEKQ